VTFEALPQLTHDGLMDGTSLAAPGNAMSEMILPSTYNEPTVMWRMQRANGSSAHALIDTVEGRPRVVWFVNGRPVGARYFDDWTAAIQWSVRLQAQYWSAGWRQRMDDFTERPRAPREP
jgi:hypothetical protein